jgi:hypothetical protein
VIIDPAGNRHSWSSRSPALRVADARSKGHEALGLTSYAGGTFIVEIVRGDPADGRPVHGRVRVRALGGSDEGGASASRDFLLVGDRVAVARVDVRWDFRLVPTDRAPVP